MLKRTLVVCLIVLAAFLFIPLSAITDDDRQANHWRVNNGVMDLAAWDAKQDTRIKLDGEWAFYWNQLLTPADFSPAGGGAPAPSAWMKVPSQWNDAVIDGVSLPARGFATYRMLLTNVPFDGVFGLKKTNARFSSAIYVNGQKVLEDGKPADNAGDYKPSNVPQLVFFPSEQREIEIIVQVANFDYINAGIPVSLYFGEQVAMSEHQQQSLALEFSMLAILGTLALIFFVFFAAGSIYRNRDYTLPALAVISSLYAVYNGLIGERALTYLLPGLSFELVYKAKDMCAIAGFIVLLVFLHRMHQSIVSRKLTLIASISLFCVLALIVILPIRLYAWHYVYVVLGYGLLLLWLLLKLGILYVRHVMSNNNRIFLLFMAVLFINLYSLDVFLFALSWKNNIWPAQLYILGFNMTLIFLVFLRFFEAYRTIDEMRNQLVHSDKIKEEFLINTSHELKTPLNAIVNITDTLLKGAEGPVTDRQAHNLAIVVESGRKLTHLVNELLDYSKMKHGDIAFYMSNLDLKAAVDSVLRMHALLLGGKPVELVSSIPDGFPAVYADGNRLIQILHNLIGNAIKFTDRGTVAVSAEIRRQMVEVRVKDTGIGIAAHMHERIFNAFEQADASETRNYGGTGLGLSITKRLVELQGGQIHVDSSPGQGTVFVFTLPLAGTLLPASQEQAAADESRIDVAAPDLRYPAYFNWGQDESILVADDDSANLQSIINLLRLEGYAVAVVNRGRMALDELAGNTDFFLVILDIMMPDMSGYEVLEKLRDRFSPAELPVLMLTARNRSTDTKLSMEKGANDFVEKPFESDELLARVRNLVRLKTLVRNAKTAEIAFLRSQIKPHFLYNALNSIAELCIDDPWKAEELTLRLSQYLRSSFDFKQLDSLTTLDNELELVETYIHIEKARFGARLQVEFDVDPDLHIRIPPLILQPIVENAVRHGLMSKLTGGKVRVSVHRETDAKVSFTIEDNGCGISRSKLEEILQPDRGEKGVGLWNISQRLKLIYGTVLRIESIEGTGTKVSFDIHEQPIRQIGG